MNGLAFGPEGKRLAAISGDGQFFVWSISKRRLLLFDKVPHPAGLTFTPDGARLLILADYGWEIVVWDLASGDRAITFRLEKPVRSPVFCGQALVAWSRMDSAIYIWDHAGEGLGGTLVDDIASTAGIRRRAGDLDSGLQLYRDALQLQRSEEGEGLRTIHLLQEVAELAEAQEGILQASGFVNLQAIAGVVRREHSRNCPVERSRERRRSTMNATRQFCPA
jgi:hypothetical protein